MENSYRYFENRKCKYYPCHIETNHMNCLFCFCPLYGRKDCPGNYKWIEVNGRKTKECKDCIFPHKPENYEILIGLLASVGGGKENS